MHSALMPPCLPRSRCTPRWASARAAPWWWSTWARRRRGAGALVRARWVLGGPCAVGAGRRMHAYANFNRGLCQWVPEGHVTFLASCGGWLAGSSLDTGTQMDLGGGRARGQHSTPGPLTAGTGVHAASSYKQISVHSLTPFFVQSLPATQALLHRPKAGGGGCRAGGRWAVVVPCGRAYVCKHLVHARGCARVRRASRWMSSPLWASIYSVAANNVARLPGHLRSCCLHTRMRCA